MKGGQNGHPEIWAVLTIITFPIVLIACEFLEVGQWWSFIYALLATFCVLVLEAIVRGRLWPFEHGFINSIGHPETPFRIMVFLGATLLVLETVAIVGAVTDPRFDEGLISLVIQKECRMRHHSKSADAICRILTEPKRIVSSTVHTSDLADRAIVEHAASVWSRPEGITKCAVRPLLRSIDARTGDVREAALVQCSTWEVSNDMTIFATHTDHKFVAARIEKGTDGLYTVSRWSEDPADDSWDMALGDMAAACRDRAEALSILPELITSMQEESKQKALEALSM